MGTGKRTVIVLYSFMFLLFNLFRPQRCAAIDVITPSRPLLVGQNITSSAQNFELGFFGLNNSGNQYVGIWFKKISPRRVVWVANKENPLTVTDSLASLKIGSDGNLKLVDGKQNTVWSTKASVQSNSSVAELLDNGNFVLKDGTLGEILWQSFNYPCDTMLPGMKLGINVTSGEKRFLTSWKSDNDPSPGNFVAGVTSMAPPQAFIWNASTPYWRSGQHDKSKFIGIPEWRPSYGYELKFEQDIHQGTTYVALYNYNSSSVRHMVLSPAGSLKLMNWDESEKELFVSWAAPKTRCDIYGACGPFGFCEESASPICRCLKGFVPKSNEEWSKQNWSGGCVRRTQLRCEKNSSTLASGRDKEDGFLKRVGLKLPDFSEYVDVGDAEKCQTGCLSNCSCVAYAYVSRIGCMIWAGELVDIQKFSFAGEDLFIRLAHTEIGSENNTEKLIISFSVITGIAILATIVYGLHRWRASQKGKRRGNTKKIRKDFYSADSTDSSRDTLAGSQWRNHLQQDPSDLPIFEFDTILVATNNFSIRNKLGQGGFGAVYKGKLQDGEEMAVKRLSSSSGQGIKEFKNEIILISKLQHRNLVRLMGCCIEGEEKLLIYEYMSNKSLDTYLFDPTKKAELDWANRFNIIQGVARGLLYLHRDSCLRVIHRDLKASNILLDETMNPKISDFGLARMFQGTQDLANTSRVVGTLGYMSPEYAMGGIFSEKSDVFSFGVLILEIVSGKKNTSFYDDEQHSSLIAYAWLLWSEGRGLNLMDEALGDSFFSEEAIKCIHIGLLCVQDHAADRPTMSTIVLMLSSETDRPQPKEPKFTFQSLLVHDQQSQWNNGYSKNEVSLSKIEGR